MPARTKPHTQTRRQADQARQRAAADRIWQRFVDLVERRPQVICRLISNGTELPQGELSEIDHRTKMVKIGSRWRTASQFDRVREIRNREG